MPSVERTAYPRFRGDLPAQELSRFSTPPEEEITFARAETVGSATNFVFSRC